MWFLPSGSRQGGGMGKQRSCCIILTVTQGFHLLILLHIHSFGDLSLIKM